MHDHWYVNFGYYSDRPNQPGYGEGGRLCRLNLRDRPAQVLLDDPKGGVRDPQVHYDGQKILFSYRKGGQAVYHLYEINADGTGLRQLTDGPYDDIEPTYLPDGGIVFVSSRCRRWVNCWMTQVADAPPLRRRRHATSACCRATTSTTTRPGCCPTASVLYTRWEYVDRSQVDFHHLWTMNPDGTRPDGLLRQPARRHGDDRRQADPGHRQGRGLVLAGPRQPEHAGVVTVVDPRSGPDDRRRGPATSAEPADFRDPWRLQRRCFLAARGPADRADGRPGPDAS